MVRSQTSVRQIPSPPLILQILVAPPHPWHRRVELQVVAAFTFISLCSWCQANCPAVSSLLSAVRSFAHSGYSLYGACILRTLSLRNANDATGCAKWLLSQAEETCRSRNRENRDSLRSFLWRAELWIAKTKTACLPAGSTDDDVIGD